MFGLSFALLASPLAWPRYAMVIIPTASAAMARSEIGVVSARLLFLAALATSRLSWLGVFTFAIVAETLAMIPAVR
jgi:hypothetical protein